jgi:hypothetical protein
MPSWAERRDSGRLPADIRANVRARGSNIRVRAEVADVSATGCKLMTSEYYVGDDVLLALAHLAPIPGQVCWARDGAVGIRFRNRLHPSIVSHLATL